MAFPTKIGSSFFFAGTHVKVEACRTADSKQKSKSCAHHGKWECNVGSGIAECADRISDKKLVCNVVYRTDEHGDNARYGKAQNQRRNFVHGKWILLF